MKINTKGNKAPTVTSLNKWGGVKNNEQLNAMSKGVSRYAGGGTNFSKLATDKSNEQKSAGETFNGFTPNRGGIDSRLGGQSQGNENPKGFKQSAKPKAYKPSGV